MSVYEIDPLDDRRWLDLLEKHPRASVFHTRAWLQALNSTYGYEPVAYTTTPSNEPLANGWVFCRVQSWLTGRRLVSLPFSDYCDPLVQNLEELQEISQSLLHEQMRAKWRYIECRLACGDWIPERFGKCEEFCLHKINLDSSLDDLYRHLHKSSIQRKINRAAREAVTYEAGCSEALLDKFYRLLVLTRRRYGVPPQPRTWFSNLLKQFGDQITVHVAAFNEIPIASIITLRFKSLLAYKYGGSDPRSFQLGGMQMLFWMVIQNAKKLRLREFDLGRSDLDAAGLIVFKDRLGAVRSRLDYYRFPVPVGNRVSYANGTGKRRKYLSYLPDGVIARGGRLLYKHFG